MKKVGSSYNRGAASCRGSLHDRNGRGRHLIVETSLTLWLGSSVNHSGEEVTGDERWRGAVVVDQKWGKLTDI